MLATMELLLMIICLSALIGFAIGVASGYMLATLGTTNQKKGLLWQNGGTEINPGNRF